MADRKADSLQRRALSALVLAPVVLGAAWLGGWAFSAVIAVAAVLMTLEWERLTSGTGSRLLAGVSAGIALLALALAGLGEVAYALMFLMGGAALVALLSYATGRRPLWAAVGVIYVCLPCVVMLWLRAAPTTGRETVIWLLTLVWATDIGAYAVGRGIGGRRLTPRVSPGKTWAGLAGGMASAALVGAAVAILWRAPGVVLLTILSASLALISQLGDLAESALKRHFGVKDTGRLIPGHGGILDRVDGLLFATAALGGLSLIGGASPLVWL